MDRNPEYEAGNGERVVAEPPVNLDRPWTPRVGDRVRAREVANLHPSVRGKPGVVTEFGPVLVVDFDYLGRRACNAEDLSPEPAWRPGDRVRLRSNGHEGEILMGARRRIYFASRFGISGITPDQIELVRRAEATPPPIPAAVVVRGLGWDDATQVDLFRDIEEARRFRYRHGGVVIPGSNVAWHIDD